MKLFKTLIAYLFILASFSYTFPAHANNIIIELNVTKQDNDLWKPKKNMHMTIAHLKDVNSDIVLKRLNQFNKENQALLKEYISKGFTVKRFTTNGFNHGHHMLEADDETTQRFSKINHLLYLSFQEINLTFSDKTTPKDINPKGYTPHIQFIEQDDKTPPPGVIIHFQDSKLQSRKQ